MDIKVKARIKPGQLETEEKRQRAADRFMLLLAAKLVKASAQEPDPEKPGD